MKVPGPKNKISLPILIFLIVTVSHSVFATAPAKGFFLPPPVQRIWSQTPHLRATLQKILSASAICPEVLAVSPAAPLLLNPSTKIPQAGQGEILRARINWAMGSYVRVTGDSTALAYPEYLKALIEMAAQMNEPLHPIEFSDLTLLGHTATLLIPRTHVATSATTPLDTLKSLSKWNTFEESLDKWIETRNRINRILALLLADPKDFPESVDRKLYPHQLTRNQIVAIQLEEEGVKISKANASLYIELLERIVQLAQEVETEIASTQAGKVPALRKAFLQQLRERVFIQQLYLIDGMENYLAASTLEEFSQGSPSLLRRHTLTQEKLAALVQQLEP